MSAKAALDLLDLAHIEFKQHKLLLEKALNAATKNERSIKNKMVSLNNALREVNSTYATWTSKSGLTDDELSSPTEKHNTAWLESLWSEVDSLQDQVDLYLESEHPAPTPDADQLLQLTKGQLESLKMDITSRIQLLLSKTSPTTQSLNTASVKVYEELYSEMNQLFSTSHSLTNFQGWIQLMLQNTSTSLSNSKETISQTL